MPMKIIHLASGDLWAGAEVQLFHLCKGLAKVNEITLRVVLLNHGQLEEELMKQGVDVVVLDESTLSGFAIIKKFHALVKDFLPDIIHTHRNKENVIGGFVAKLNGVKSIRTIHGANELIRGKVNFRRLLFDGLDKLAASYFQQKIVAISPELKQDLEKIFSPDKLALIENSVDIEYVVHKSKEKCKHSVDADCFNVAFIGRFVPVKNVDMFYEIAKTTIAKVTNSPIHFHMIGDGPLKEKIAARRLSDGLQDYIHMHGFIENAAPLLKKMNLLVFTSEHEGLPMTLLEAMTLSVPVLSRHLPSIRNVLCDGECGYFIQTDNAEEYANCIQLISKNSASAKEKAMKARDQLNEKYNLHANITRYRTLYESVVSAQAKLGRF